MAATKSIAPTSEEKAATEDEMMRTIRGPFHRLKIEFHFSKCDCEKSTKRKTRAKRVKVGIDLNSGKRKPRISTIATTIRYFQKCFVSQIRG
jgi:hypothetical protein